MHKKVPPLEIRDYVKITYVGNFYNHGEPLAQWATGFVLLLSKIKRIKRINVLCPINDDGKPEISMPEQVIVHPCYDIEKPFTLVNILKELSRDDSSLIFFNLNSTSFGNNSLSNLVGLSLPFLAPLTGKRSKVIYHSSVFTNDPAKLGYDSFYDKIRKIVLFGIEFSVFRFLDTYVLLDTYRSTIDRRVKNNRVKTLRNHYFEAMPTIFLNGLMDQSELPNKPQWTDNP